MHKSNGTSLNNKPKNFSVSMKRLFNSLKQWKILLLIAIILAATSSVFSLISPNKLSNITDAITKGIIPNQEGLVKVTEKITSNFSDKDKIEEKVIKIMQSNDVSNEDKLLLQQILSNKDENNFLNIPDNILLLMLSEEEIDGTLISKEDQLQTLKLLSTVDKADSNSMIKVIDELPESIYNIIKPNMDMKYIGNISLFLLILYIIGAVFSYIESLLLSITSNNYAKKLRKNISFKINKLPLKYFDTHETGDILSRITNDVDTISQNLNNSLSTLVSSITLFIGSIIMMFTTNWIMAISAIISSIIGFALMISILGKSQKYFDQKQIELGKLNGHIEEIYSGHNIVKVYNGEECSKKEFDELNKKLYECNQKSQFLSGLMPSLMGFVGNLGYVVVCIVGALLVLSNNISFGVIVAFMIYVRLFTSPLSQIAQALTGLQSTLAASERVFEFLDEKELSNQDDIHNHLDSTKIKGEIEFKNIKFGYDLGKTIINNFSIKVKPGQKVAIVGPTGAGKTTIINLLMKFYEINEGDILIDGISTKKLTRENIHKLFTMVLQDTWLFEGTVRDNIKFNRENIDDEELWHALRIVGVDHFIQTLPGGLDAVIDDGDSISQGQKQLITIARGMIEDSPFLILDEATSNVDTRTEELVQQAMDKLIVGRTSFIIAHRLSTIKNADIILVLKDGNIIEKGNHDELMNKQGFYFELYNSQFTKINS